LKVAPKPDVASSIRKLPESAAGPKPTSVEAPSSPSPRSPATGPKPQVQALAESRYRVELTASTALRDKLEHACALISHRNPGGDFAVVIEAALDLFIEKLEKERFGKTTRPRKAKPPADPGHVTQAARREVAERDGQQCSFVRDDGVPARRVPSSSSTTKPLARSAEGATRPTWGCSADRIIAAPPRRSSVATTWRRAFACPSASAGGSSKARLPIALTNQSCRASSNGFMLCPVETGALHEKSARRGSALLAP
jgi:hypothetical protein